MKDPIERQSVSDLFDAWEAAELGHHIPKILRDRLKAISSAQSESTRTFVELVVRYPDPELCIYKEYKGKPYYSIKYIENGETHVGYGTYNPEVLSQYLKEYFILSAEPKIIHCEECAHGVHSGHGDIYLCTVSPEEVREHKYNFYCGYADRRTD